MIKAIQHWHRQRAFRRSVLSYVDYFVGLTDVFEMTGLLRTYPNYKEAIADHFHQGDGVELTVLTLLTVWLTDHIERRFPASRVEAAYSQLENWFTEQEKGHTPDVPQEPIALLTLLINQKASAWVTTERIDKVDGELFISEILGALKGETFQERSANRIVGGLLSKVMEGTEFDITPSGSADAATTDDETR